MMFSRRPYTGDRTTGCVAKPTPQRTRSDTASTSLGPVFKSIHTSSKMYNSPKVTRQGRAGVRSGSTSPMFSRCTSEYGDCVPREQQEVMPKLCLRSDQDMETNSSTDLRRLSRNRRTLCRRPQLALGKGQSTGVNPGQRLCRELRRGPSTQVASVPTASRRSRRHSGRQPKCDGARSFSDGALRAEGWLSAKR
jgi:hypothetical protein